MTGYHLLRDGMKTKPNPTKALCTMTYSDPATGETRLCQDGSPRPAAYKRLNVRVCADCWPEVSEALLEKFTPANAPAIVKAVGLARTFKRVA